MSAALFRAGILAATLLLLWRVIDVDFVLYDDSGRPRLPASAEASTGPVASDGEILKRVLDTNPGEVDALLLLARDRERAGDLRETRRAYQAAFEVAPMDREVLGSGSQFYLQQGETAPALAMLDRLVEIYPEARPRAFPVLAQLLVERRDPAAWDAIAERKGAWVGTFIESACRQGTDPTYLVPLYLRRARDRRASAEEGVCLIEKLRESDRWPEAYQLWLNTLPAERLTDVGHIFNGSFEHAATGIGFDWVISPARGRDAGFSVEISQAAGPGGKRSLHVIYSGKRQLGMPVMQYLALPPGRYEMSGNARPQAIAVGRGVQWALHCVKGGKAQPALAASERFVGSSEWRRFAFEVVIPADCPGQLLQLEPVGLYTDGVVYISGSAWFDDLVLRRRG